MDYSEKDVIKASKGDDLLGKKITLCITGSVSAYRSVDLARELIRYGADVYVVMSENATNIIHPYTLEWATGNPVVTEITGKVEHIPLAEDVDLVLVAPATANTIAKAAYGVSDTPVTLVLSVALGSGIPILIIPAMHEPMYDNPFLKDALARLKSAGVQMLEPRREEAKAKIPETEDILFEAFNLLYAKDLDGYRLLITAGPSIEYIDTVRIITNMSSGKMGLELAKDAYLRGAKVTLILGKTSLDIPNEIRVMKVETTREMYDAVMDELSNDEYDVFIGAAAPVDYTPSKKVDVKIDSREHKTLSLDLVTTPKIIEGVRKKSKKIFLVAFKAEYHLSNEDLINKARRYANKLGLDIVVANDLSREGVGFGVDTNEVFIVNRDGLLEHIPISSKRKVASKIINNIVRQLSSGK